jgi:hypothetical protein
MRINMYCKVCIITFRTLFEFQNDWVDRNGYMEYVLPFCSVGIFDYMKRWEGVRVANQCHLC